MEPQNLHLVYKDGEVKRTGDLQLTPDTGYEFTLFINEYLLEKEEKRKKLIAQKGINKNQKILEAALLKLDNDQDEELISKYKDTKYIYVVANNSVNITSRAARHIGMETGIGISRTFSEIAIGGGKLYLEAIREGTEPKNKPPYGIFVSALGEPEILGIVWTDYDDNVIEGEIAPGSHVLLHIYTKDMYGQEIDITLRDNDFADSDNNLADKEDKNEPNGMANEEIYSKRCEVNLYPAGKIELKDGVKDRIFSIGSNESVLNIQKAIMPLRVSEGVLWKKEAGYIAKSLHIYPSIFSVELQKTIYETQDKFLKVNYAKKDLPKPQLKEYRTPITVNQVNTALGASGACFFTNIKANVQTPEKEPLPEIVLFDEKNPDLNSIRRFVLPVTAGIKDGTAKIDVTMDTDTDLCNYDETERDHQNRVIDLSRLNVFAKKGIVEGTYIGWDKSNNTSESELYNKNPIINLGKFNVNPTENLKSEALEKILLLQKSKPFQLKAKDTGINMEVAYNYSNYGNQNFLTGLAKSLLPIRSGVQQIFPIKIDTCRYPNRSLEVHVYPDIKWTLQVAYNYDKEKFNKVCEAYHKKQERKIQKIDEKLKAAKAEKDNKYEEDGKKKKRAQKVEDSNKVKKLEAKKANAKSKKSLKGKAKKFFDLLEPDDSLERDVIEFEAGLTCEFDGGKHSVEVSSLFPEVLDFIRKIADLKKKVDSVINGTDGDTTKQTPNNDTVDKRTEKLRKRIEQNEAKKASGWSFEFIPPEIGLSISWYAERPNDVSLPKMGISVEGVLHVDPILGFEIKYDIFKLFGRIPHPVVKGVVMTLEVLDDYVLGDKFDIDLDFVVTGKTYAYGKGKFNSIAQSSYRNRRDETPFKLGGSLFVALEGRVYAATRVDTVFWGKAKAYLDMTASLSTGFALEGQLASNGKGGFSWDTILRFEGIIIKGSFTAGVAGEGKKGEETDEEGDTAPEIPTKEKGLHYTAGGLIVMDAYEWKL